MVAVGTGLSARPLVFGTFDGWLYIGFSGSGPSGSALEIENSDIPGLCLLICSYTNHLVDPYCCRGDGLVFYFKG